MRRLSLFLLGSLCFSDVPAQDSSRAVPARTVIPPEVETVLESHLDVVYASYDDRTLELDLYRPKGTDETLPGIVCIHGGGWWQGDRSSHSNLAKALAARGYVTATISYRLSGEAPYPAAIHDCKAAVRFLRANSEEYGIDPSRIGAIGLSAGGHLTALLATSAGVPALEGEGGHAEQDSSVQAAVPLGAQTDFRRHHENIEQSEANPPGEKPNIWLQFLGARPSEAPERWKEASPITHLDVADPPMLFITGENDSETTHAEKFRERMRELGIEEGLLVIPGAPHAFLGRQEWFDAMVEASAGWFDHHLSKE